MGSIVSASAIPISFIRVLELDELYVPGFYYPELLQIIRTDRKVSEITVKMTPDDQLIIVVSQDSINQSELRYLVYKLRKEMNQLQTLLSLVSCSDIDRFVANYERRVTDWNELFHRINRADASLLVDLKYLCAEFSELNKILRDLQHLQSCFAFCKKLHYFASSLLAIDFADTSNNAKNVQQVIAAHNPYCNEKAPNKPLLELWGVEQFMDELGTRLEPNLSLVPSTKEEFLAWFLSVAYPKWRFTKPAGQNGEMQTCFEYAQPIWLGNQVMLVFTPSDGARLSSSERGESLDGANSFFVFLFKQISVANATVHRSKISSNKSKVVCECQIDGSFKPNITLPQKDYDHYSELPTDARIKQEQLLRNELDCRSKLLLNLVADLCEDSTF